MVVDRVLAHPYPDFCFFVLPYHLLSDPYRSVDGHKFSEGLYCENDLLSTPFLHSEHAISVKVHLSELLFFKSTSGVGHRGMKVE